MKVSPEPTTRSLTVLDTHQHLARFGHRRQPGPDVNRHATQVPARELTFPGVDAGADLEVQMGEAVDELEGAFDGSGR